MDTNQELMNSPGIRFAIPPFIFLILAVLAGAVHWLLFDGLAPLAILTSLTKLLQLGLGVTLGLAGFIFMMTAWFHFVFVGTTVTVNDPVSRLVENGAFRYSRNPMYVGFVAILLAIAIALASLPYLIAALVMFFYLDRYIIPREERYMKSVFTEDYQAYCNKVRRWL